MIVLDACVIIAYLDPAHRKNQTAIQVLIDAAGQDKVMSAVTAAESMVHRAKAGQRRQAEATLTSLGIEVVEVPSNSAARLANLRASTGLKMPDAIVLDLALCLHALVATFDEPLAQAARQAGLTVIN